MFARAQCIRRFENTSTPTVHLTFDDGPDPICTPRVLELLERHDAKATFFVVASKARKHPELIAAMKKNGHALGNHSLDHNTLNYLRGPKHLEAWIRKAEEELSHLWEASTCGFRPPVGIQTPPLHEALRNMNMPMILWSERFYDKVLRWSKAKALSHAQRVSAGSIILLHDEQSAKHRDTFLDSLDFYLTSLAKRGLQSVAL